MQSSNSKFNEYGWASMIRDVESLYLQLTDLGQEAEGQSSNLTTLQQSVAQANTNVSALANRLTTDEATIASLQSQISGISSYKTSNDWIRATNLAGQAMDGNWDTATFTATSGSLSGLNAGTGVFTAPATGIYLFVCGAIVSFGGSSFYAGVSMYDGTTRYCRQIIVASAQAAIDVSTTVALSMTAGSTIQMNVVASYGTSASSAHELMITRL